MADRWGLYRPDFSGRHRADDTVLNSGYWSVGISRVPAIVLLVPLLPAIFPRDGRPG
jgi:hypothetical protein